MTQAATEKRTCKCRNHKGNPKNQYKTWEQALRVALRKATRFGDRARAYPCPTSDRWHVTTKRKRRRRHD